MLLIALVRFEGVNDGADDLVSEKVLSSDLDDARWLSGEDIPWAEVRRRLAAR